MKPDSKSKPMIDLKSTDIRLGVFLVGVGLVLSIFFGLLGTDLDVTFEITSDGDFFQIPDVIVAANSLNSVAGLIVLMVGLAIILAPRFEIKLPGFLKLLAGMAVIIGLLGWIAAGSLVRLEFILGTALVLAVPLVLGSLSGIMSERVGVVNIAIEAQLLTGAFVGAVVGSITGNLLIGLAMAAVGAAILSIILAVFSIRFMSQQIIVGVVLNVLMLGVTNFLYQQWLTPQSQDVNSPGTLDLIRVPLLADIPLLGTILFENRLTTYLAIVLVPLVWFVLFRTRIGLRARAVGEHPLAAETLGVNVARTRFWWVVAGGAVAGLGGAALSIGSAGAFGRGMSVGYGFIALAIVILGGWHPYRASAAALLFGFSIILQVWSNNVNENIPSDLVLMVPYLVTLFTVVAFSGKFRPPAASGVPYRSGKSL